MRIDGGAERHFGLYPAIVSKLVGDPQNLQRVEVKLPWLGRDAGGQDVRAWARLLSPYADDQQGFQCLPEVDSEVVLAFEAGDLRRPYIVGACWNGQAAMPEAPAEANDKRLWKSRAGSVLEFDDKAGAAKVTLALQSGHCLVLDDAAQTLEVRHASGCVITLNAAGQVQIEANATVEVHAAALNVHCATAAFDGIVTCTTLVASSGVVSPSYTPGAGNIW
jgi:uncharacterized protein involved in type VI secretion and phage assembly